MGQPCGGRLQLPSQRSHCYYFQEMEESHFLRDQLLRFYTTYNTRQLAQTDPYVEQMVHIFSEVIDEMIQRVPPYNTEFAESISEDFFRYNLAPPALVLRQLDVNRVEVARRRYRRARRKASGKENRRLH